MIYVTFSMRTNPPRILFYDDDVTKTYDTSLYPNNFVITVDANANALAIADLDEVKTIALTEYKHRFNKWTQIDIVNGMETWTPVNLLTEIDNDTKVYNCFLDLTCENTRVVGLQDAIALNQSNQDFFISSSKLDKVYTIDKIPTQDDIDNGASIL